MQSQSQIHEQITHQIIEALTSGSLPPWRQPWLSHHNAGFPTNVVSKRRYSGVNPLLMQMAAQRHGLRSKFWATFKQWQSLGGMVKRRPADVRPGEWGTSIVFWKPVTKTEVDPKTGDEEEITFGFLKNYTVFNADQVDGDFDHLRVADIVTNNDFIDFKPAERAIEATEADIRFGGDAAFYRRPNLDGDGDFIQMPPKHSFSPPSEYYATALHELMHWSECRLGWSGNYSEGELRAEIAACYAITELGVPQSEDLSNHHAYLDHWLGHLERDARYIFAACTAASKAAEFVLSFSRVHEPVEEPVLA